MLKISDIKQRFKEQQISKQDFICQMHAFHEILSDFSKTLSATEILRIEIEDNNLLFISRPTSHHPGEVKFHVDTVDKQSSPLNAFNFDKYEKNDSDIIYNLISNCKIIFDIGANVGWYSNHFARKTPDCTVYAFEPIEDIFLQLENNVKTNGFKNVIINNSALSDNIGTQDFYYSAMITGASSAVNITEDDSMTIVRCKTDTINNFVKNHNLRALDFIKCDVEGSELFVFKGGIEAIEKFKPIIFTEMLRKWSAKFNYHPNDIIALLRNIGYRCFIAKNNALDEIMQVTDDTIETNFFFLHQDQHASKISTLTPVHN